jgi:hypothetical protein
MEFEGIWGHYFAMRNIVPDYPFSKVVFSSFLSQNSKPWHLFWKDLEGFCASMQSPRYLISFFDENSTGCSYRQCFLLPISCRKLYTDFSVMRCKKRKKWRRDVFQYWSIGAPSFASSCVQVSHWKRIKWFRRLFSTKICFYRCDWPRPSNVFLTFTGVYIFLH